ncbi:MAG: NUDIX domain-containing protein [Spirochaetales bacterium]|nr:NUDIX domain-containing protein [Spirochaetales bacterium]
MIFTFCPRCKAKKVNFDGFKEYSCISCGYTFYHNPAAAVAALIPLNDKVLMIKRARDPGKGKLDLPGGFVDPGESAENALRREIREELGVEIRSLTYFGSYPNIYNYKRIEYHTCDLVFIAEIEEFPEHKDDEEIEETIMISPCALMRERIAFDSIKHALKDYCALLRRNPNGSR